MFPITAKSLTDQASKTGFLQRHFQSWLHKRLPPERSILLTSKNIFIFPSRAGFAFVFLFVLLWLVATNYENNLVFAITFLLSSLFIVSILYTFGNLSGLRISLVNSHPVFKGEDAGFELLVEKQNKRLYENIMLSWSGNPSVVVNLIEHEQKRITLHFPATRRGRMTPGRLLVETYYPLGLLRAWSWLDLDAAVLVYPQPVKAGPLPGKAGNAEQGDIVNLAGNDDFYGFRKYQPSESLNHVSWKHYAKGQGLLSKEYSETVMQCLWLDWDDFDGLGRESRLSRLCYWVLEAAKSKNEYGLRLPGIEISPGKGEQHRNKLLGELALFEWEKQS